MAKLLLGLAGMLALEASLLLNAQRVFTALLAWFIFKENLDFHIALGMAAIVAGVVVMSFSLVCGIWVPRAPAKYHQHAHEDAGLNHAHGHVHHTHHRHDHNVAWGCAAPHDHPHAHAPLRHERAHFPDIDNRSARMADSDGKSRRW